MSGEVIKRIARPKVRFSQIPEVESKTPSKEGAHEDIAGPRIKSIVTLEKPVKVVHHGALHPKDPDTGTASILDTAKRKCLDNPKRKWFKIIQPPFTCSNPSETNRQSPLDDARNIQNVRANKERLDKDKSFGVTFNDKIENADMSTVLVVNEHVPTHKLQSPLRNINTRTSQACVKNNMGKENKKLKDNADIRLSKKIIKSNNFDTALRKQITSAAVANNTKKTLSTTMGSAKIQSVAPTAKHTVKSSCVLSKVFKENWKTKNLATNVMPCYKYNRCSSSRATHIVKRATVNDIIDHNTETYVGPGILHNQQDKDRQLEVHTVVRNKINFANEKFLQPEYNSIICTINELTKVKQEKIVMDTEQLPATYKNVINEKVSKVLDFPLGEAVYKNLVDLTIDEKELPRRITRSKDPEPMQKDIIPQLSDFFVPELIDEHCTSVSIKSRAPEIMDNWSAFTISNKVFQWKDRLDNIE